MIQAMTMKEEIARACVASGPGESGTNHKAMGTAEESRQPIILFFAIGECFTSSVRFKVGTAIVILIFFQFRLLPAKFGALATVMSTLRP